MIEMPDELPDRAFPGTLPIFPLTEVLLLPRGRLPLHIFEPRYVAMVEDCLIGDRMIGMVQPVTPETPTVYTTGCSGRITAFRDLEDGRYLVTLTGVCRFRIREELEQRHGYRRVVPMWDEFRADLQCDKAGGFDRSRLLGVLPCYLKKNDIAANWETIQGAPDERLVTSLSMICPFQANEKQALLEAPTLAERARLLISLIEMATVECRDRDRSVCH